MAKICLVSCVSLKDTRKAKAGDMYLSSLFKKAKEYATNKKFNCWYILSAKYGLLRPDDLIEPYEMTLNSMAKVDRCKWAKKVFLQLQEFTRPCDEITFLAGQRYRNDLVPLLTNRGNKVYVPLEGLRIGEQLKWLTQNNSLNDKKL